MSSEAHPKVKPSYGIYNHQMNAHTGNPKRIEF